MRMGSSDSRIADVRLLCEIVLILNRRGFGRLRCFPQMAPSGLALRCGICVSPLNRPSTHYFWSPIWWYDPGAANQVWELPAVGLLGRNAEKLASDCSATGFVAIVIGSKHSADAVGDPKGYDDWLEKILARSSGIVPILLWDWYETPNFIETIPGDRSLKLPFPPGFFSNNNELFPGKPLPTLPQVQEGDMSACDPSRAPTGEFLRKAVYTHAPSSTGSSTGPKRELVTVVKVHPPSEGGGITVFIPSLGRERSTVEERLNFDLSVLDDIT